MGAEQVGLLDEAYLDLQAGDQEDASGEGDPGGNEHGEAQPKRWYPAWLGLAVLVPTWVALAAGVLLITTWRSRYASSRSPTCSAAVGTLPRLGVRGRPLRARPRASGWFEPARTAGPVLLDQVKLHLEPDRLCDLGRRIDAV